MFRTSRKLWGLTLYSTRSTRYRGLVHGFIVFCWPTWLGGDIWKALSEHRDLILTWEFSPSNWALWGDKNWFSECPCCTENVGHTAVPLQDPTRASLHTTRDLTMLLLLYTQLPNLWKKPGLGKIIMGRTLPLEAMLNLDCEAWQCFLLQADLTAAFYEPWSWMVTAGQSQPYGGRKAS